MVSWHKVQSVVVQMWVGQEKIEGQIAHPNSAHYLVPFPLPPCSETLASSFLILLGRERGIGDACVSSL